MNQNERQYTVLAPLTFGHQAAHVHLAGCSDVKNPLYQRQERHTITATSPVEAALDLLNGDGLGYTQNDVKVFPCCRQAAKFVSAEERAAIEAKAANENQ